MGPHDSVLGLFGWTESMFDRRSRAASSADVRKYIREILSLGFNAGVKGVDVNISAREITGIKFNGNHIELSTDDVEISFDLMDGNKLENFVLKG